MTVPVWRSTLRACLFLALALASAFLPAGAGLANAQSRLRAEVDRTQMSTDDILTLSLILESESASLNAPPLPSMDGFDLVGTSSQTQMSIANGKVSNEARWIYQLRPTQLGQITIPPMRVQVGQERLETDAIVIEVSPGSMPTPEPALEGRSSAGRDFWVEATVDRPQPFVGQAVNYVFRFYQTYRLGLRPSYAAPSFQGFWSEAPQQRVYNTRQAGRDVRVIELRHVLFPTRSGKLQIEPATFDIPGGFGSRAMHFETEPVELSARELPPGAPDDFQGAVGRYTIAATLDSAQGKVGEPLRLRVTLSGEGNIAALPEPVWPRLPAAWTWYAGAEQAETQVENGKVTGSRSFERFIIPASQGSAELPGIPYSYFDPIEERYRSVQTGSARLEILAGEVAPPAAAQARSVAPIRLASDARPSRDRRPFYLLLALLPLALMGLEGSWNRRRETRRLLRRLHEGSALTRALKLLDSEAATESVGAGEWSRAQRALESYVALKLEREPGGLKRAEILVAIESAGLDTDLIRRWKLLLLQADQAAFAPEGRSPAVAGGGIAVDEPLERCRALLEDTESAWPS